MLKASCTRCLHFAINVVFMRRNPLSGQLNLESSLNFQSPCPIGAFLFVLLTYMYRMMS